jgi:hypothetical protein
LSVRLCIQVSIAPSAVVFLVATMIAITASLGWSTYPTAPQEAPAVFFLFFIWPLVCMSIFVVLQSYVLVTLYLSWKTVGTCPCTPRSYTWVTGARRWMLPLLQ